MPIIHIGLDDTDSKKGMCTTYIGALIVDRLSDFGVTFVDLPYLIRLNPNWPMKTRGNCAVALRIETTAEKLPLIKEITLKTVEEFAELECKTTNPGVAFYVGLRIPDALRHFSKRVIQDIVTIEDAEKVAKEVDAELHKFKLGRGVVGALAAIGELLEEDKTYELIAYRVRDNWGTKRRLDKSSVYDMNEKTYPGTFDNIDPQTDEIRITPHTPCPILYGIRAETIHDAFTAYNLVVSFEPIERWVIYKTNQATDGHIILKRIAELESLRSAVVKGDVSEKPKVISGGHVIFKIKDLTGEIDCAAYEPTRKFREIVKKLELGDCLKVYGGVKQKPDLPLTINLEKLEVLQLTEIQRKVNPRCTTCGKTLTSAGKNKGFFCKKCKQKYPGEKPITIKLQRTLSTGLYEVPPRARRHLAMPLIRKNSKNVRYKKNYET
jgi:tRNA(Ile2)-agmatinylcytidine synthase